MPDRAELAWVRPHATTPRSLAHFCAHAFNPNTISDSRPFPHRELTVFPLNAIPTFPAHTKVNVFLFCPLRALCSHPT